MATYLQGVTDYIPQIQPFTPEYGFYNKALRFKQSKYDANVQSLNNVYGSLLNSELSREDTTASRDEFFKKIEPSIKKMAGTDLSKSQNATAANQVFNQILDNDLLVKDMAFTKNFRKEMSRAQNYKNCVDEEACGGGWWEGGEQLLQYNKMAFAEASADQAMNMGNASYIPSQNINKKAIALAKEMNLAVPTITEKGGFILKEINGQAAAPHLYKMFNSVLGQDAKTVEYYNAQAQLGRENAIASGMQQGMDRNQAEQQYISQVLAAAEGNVVGGKNKSEEKVIQTKENIAKLDKAAQIAGPKEKQTIEEKRATFEQELGVYDQESKAYADLNNENDLAKANQQYSGPTIDRMIGRSMLDGALIQSATDLAYMNYKMDMQVNPYSLEKVRHQNALDQALFKAKLKAIETDAANKKNNPEGGLIQNREATKGGVDVNQTKQEQLETNIENVTGAVARSETDSMSMMNDRMRVAADRGDHQAADDYVETARNYLAAKGEGKRRLSRVTLEEQKAGIQPEAETLNTLERSTLEALSNPNLTQAQKYQEARKLNMDLGSLAPEQADILYNGAYKTLINNADDTQPYLKKLLENDVFQQKQNDIAAQSHLSNQINEDYAKTIVDLKAVAKNDGNLKQIDKDALENYWGKDGGINSFKEFETLMIRDGYDKDDIKEMWGETSGSDDSFLEDGVEVAAAYAGTNLALATVAGFMAGPGAAAAIALGPAGWLLGGAAAAIAFAYNYSQDDEDVGGIHKLAQASFEKHAVISKANAKGLLGSGAEATGSSHFSFNSKSGGLYSGAIKQFLQESTNGTSKALFNMGGFQESRENLPKSDSKEGVLAKNFAEYFMDYLYTGQSKTDGVKGTATYQNITLGDDDMVGYHIKPKLGDLSKFKPLLEGMSDKEKKSVLTNGFTVYMPKNETSNALTKAAEWDMYDTVITQVGKVELPTFNNITGENGPIALNRDPNSGQYYVSGEVFVGYGSDGKALYQELETPNSFQPGVPVSIMVAEMKKELRVMQAAARKKFAETNKKS